MTGSDELVTIPVLVTCHTEECANVRIQIELELYDPNMRVMCGVCGNDIEDKINT